MNFETQTPHPDGAGDATAGSANSADVPGAAGALGDFHATATVPEHDGRSGNRRAVFGAVFATIAVVVSLLIFLVRPDDGAATTSPVGSTVPTSSPRQSSASQLEASAIGVATAASVPGLEPVPTVPDIGAVPVPTVPSSQAPQTPTVIPPAPPSGQTSPPPPPPPPTPTPVLHVQPSYRLDPGVHGVTISVANTGDAALTFALANVGEGYTTDAPAGDLEPGTSADLWLDLDVAPEGDGPTPFERTIKVTSTGGDATISITGQFEKPGFLVPDHASLPLVDYRATVSFTNVGGLPVTITQLDAPGFTYGPLPDTVEAGETFTIDVAICAADADLLPVFASVPIPGLPFPGFRYGGEVTVGTVEGSATTELSAMTPVFTPPTCDPVVVSPTADLTLGG